MFSGIVEEVGRVVRRSFSGSLLQIVIAGKRVTPELKEGESVAVNGVCLTVEGKQANTFVVWLSSQTQKETTLGRIEIGEPVNLERALTFGGRLGGHLLTGHIDFQTSILFFQRTGDSALMKIKIDYNHLRYVVRRGSLGVDGVSLTVAELDGGLASFYLVPYTLANTTLAFKRVGSWVNVETDILAKYLDKLWKER